MNLICNSRDILEARDLEYKAWAHVNSLKSSLDEQSLELRVKTANEAEAISQQKLAAAEAEIADMRQKLESFKRLIFPLLFAVEKVIVILLDSMILFYILIIDIPFIEFFSEIWLAFLMA